MRADGDHSAPLQSQQLIAAKHGGPYGKQQAAPGDGMHSAAQQSQQLLASTFNRASAKQHAAVTDREHHVKVAAAETQAATPLSGDVKPNNAGFNSARPAESDVTLQQEELEPDDSEAMQVGRHVVMLLWRPVTTIDKVVAAMQYLPCG